MLKAIQASIGLLTKREKYTFFGIVLARVLAQTLDLAGVAGVALLGSLAGNALSGGNREGADSLPVLDGLLAEIDALGYSALVFLVASLFITKSVIAAMLLRLTTRFISRIEAQKSIEIAEYLFGGDLERLESYPTQERLWLVNQSAQTAYSNILYSTASIISEGMLFVFIFSSFFLVDPLTSLLIVVYFTTLLAAFQVAINLRLRRLGIRLGHSFVNINGTVSELSRVFREASVLGGIGSLTLRFGQARTQLAKDEGTQRFVMALPRFFVEVALMFGVAALVFFQLESKDLSSGIASTAVFIAGGFRVIAALLPLQNSIADIRVNAPQAEKAQSILRRARAVQEESSLPPLELEAPTPPESPTTIVISGLSYYFPGATTPALTKVNMEIQIGSKIAFIGQSGGGKTTLAELILGLRRPTEGHISLSGPKSNRGIGEFEGRRAYMPQRPQLIARSLAENIAFGVNPESIDRTRVLEVLKISGLSDLEAQLPQGIDTNLLGSENGLSIGQIQRVGLARALYTKPDLVVFDEPTSSLDFDTESFIYSRLSTELTNATVITIAHRLSTIRNADAVYNFTRGEVKLATETDLSAFDFDQNAHSD